MTVISQRLIQDWTRRNRWIWSLFGVLILWMVISSVSDRFSLNSLSGVAVSASFLTIVALGQMFVITSGSGNIDLSVGSVLTLSAYAGVVLIHGDNARLPLGILAVAAIGLAVGLVNAALVVLCRLPAMIGTLATGYILATATLFANRGVRSFAVCPILRFLGAERVAGLPVMMLIALAAVAMCIYVLNWTVFGRLLTAAGQNDRAAYLAGVRVNRTIAATFVISSVVAALDGLLLSAYVGGAFLEMGIPYLLHSIAAVVLGGSLVMGGSSTAVGTMFGGVLLVLIVATMQIANLPPGAQDIVEGLVVISVLALAASPAGRRIRRRSAART
jgi:ribose transport system permease protein